MKANQGFTLLELMVVVIIIGILAGVAVPQYSKTIERTRMTEAVAILGAIRSSEIRYRAMFGTYTATEANLDFSFTTDLIGIQAFSYAVTTNATFTDFDATATRKATPAVGAGCNTTGYQLHIIPAGTITGLDGQTTTSRVVL